MLNQTRKKKILYIDATTLYGHLMCQPLPYDDIKFERNVCLGELINIPNDTDIGYLLEIDLRYPYNKRQKTKCFPFCPEE